MKKEIQTSGPVAKTDFFSLPHIGEGKISDMNAVLRDTRANKITLMRGIFNDLTGKKLQIIEQDKNSHNESNVILRDANGRAIDRLGHGTDIQAVSIPGLVKEGVNDNGYHFEEMKDVKGRKRIFVEIQTTTGKSGYVAIEHIGVKEEMPVIPPPPVAPPVVPPVIPPPPVAPPVVPPVIPPPPVAPHVAPPVIPPTAPVAPHVAPPVIPPTAPVAPHVAPNPDLAKETLKSVKIDSPITYGEFAKKNNTTVAVLNGINSLNLLESTILPKGSELYVPALKKPKSDTPSVPNPGTDGDTDKKGERVVDNLALSEKILAKLNKTPAEKTALQQWLSEKSSDLKGYPYGPNTTQTTLLDFLSQQQESIKDITVDTTKNNITVTLSNSATVTFAQ